MTLRDALLADTERRGVRRPASFGWPRSIRPQDGAVDFWEARYDERWFVTGLTFLPSDVLADDWEVCS
jgi:hypothetical protein